MLQAIGIPGSVGRGQPGGRRMYSHAHTLLDLKPGMGSQEVNLVVRRGATVTGQVVGPDGQPVRDAWMFSRLILDPSVGACEDLDRPLSRQGAQRPFRDPRARRPMPRSPSISSSRNASWAASSTSRPSRRRAGRSPSGSSPAAPPGRALVDPGGKPVAGPLRDLDHHDGRDPRSHPLQFLAERQGRPPLRRRGRTDQVDPVNYEKEPAPDADGRITLPVLIPGATYRFIDCTMSSAARPARRSARNSPSSRARRSTWATSGSRRFGRVCPDAVPVGAMASFQDGA